MDRANSLAAAEAVAAIEAGEACWTWQLWGQPLLSTDRGRWALTVLSQFFGPSYLNRIEGRFPVGLFDQAIAPQYGQDRVDRVLELATRLAVLRSQDGYEALAAEAGAETQPSYLRTFRRCSPWPHRSRRQAGPSTCIRSSGRRGGDQARLLRRTFA